jgi:hypothetical protein
VLEQLRILAMQRPTYGYRRLWALLRRQRRAVGLPPVNTKRVYRLAKTHKFLLQRYTGSPPVRVHEGTVAVERSDQRYCLDGLEITCDNGERARVTFSLDCCDRQAIAFAATTAGISGELVRDVMVETLIKRFGEVPELPHPAEWLSDNGSGYIARETRSLPPISAWFRAEPRIARRRAMGWQRRSLKPSNVTMPELIRRPMPLRCCRSCAPGSPITTSCIRTAPYSIVRQMSSERTNKVLSPVRLHRVNYTPCFR